MRAFILTTLLLLSLHTEAHKGGHRHPHPPPPPPTYIHHSCLPPPPPGNNCWPPPCVPINTGLPFLGVIALALGIISLRRNSAL